LLQPKRVRDLAQSDWSSSRREQVDQQLEADSGSAVDRFVDEAPVCQEKATHRIANRGVQHQTAQLEAEIAQLNSLGCELPHAGAVGMTAGNHDVQLVLAGLKQHARQNRFVMLKIAIHDGDVGGGGGHHAFEAR
jgi:hypothetical protein